MGRAKSCVVLVSAVFVMLLGASMISGASVIHIALLEYYDKSPVITAWLGSLFTSMFCFASIFGSALINTFNTRICIIVGGCFNLLGFACSSIVPDFDILFLTYGILGGFGQSICYSGSYVVVGFYFDKYRSLATGVIVSGFALGQIIHPILVQQLLSHYSLQGTFLLLGALGFQTCVFAALIQPHPLELERKEKRNPKEKPFSIYNSFTKLCHSLIDHIHVVLIKSFLLFCFSIICWSSSLGIFTLYITEYFYVTGSSLAEASLLTSLVGIGSVCSRILMGLAAVDSSIDGKTLYFGSYGILGLVTLFLPVFGQYLPGKAFFALFFGLYSGGTWSLLSSISVELVGIHNLATAFGIEMIAAGTGFVVGPIIGGIILSTGEEFRGVFIFAGCMHFLAAFFGMLMVLFIPKSKQDQASSQQRDYSTNLSMKSDQLHISKSRPQQNLEMEESLMFLDNNEET